MTTRPAVIPGSASAKDTQGFALQTTLKASPLKNRHDTRMFYTLDYTRFQKNSRPNQLALAATALASLKTSGWRFTKSRTFIADSPVTD